MKINKKQAGLIVGLVCVVILILLLLTMCNGSGNSSAQTEPSIPSESVEQTETTVETTEAAEETTEATEETTEATEETVAGSSTPGGTTGYNPSTGGSNTTTTEKTPAAGSKDSPYTESISEFPDSVSTIVLPTSGTVYYNLNLDDETVQTYGQSLLTIEDENAYVIYNGTTYKAENGIVSVSLTAPGTEGAPVTIQLGSKQKAAVVLNFNAPLGTKENPDSITWDENGIIAVEASVASGDTYYYDFTAEDDGTLTLTLDEITENADCDVTVTIGQQQVDLTAGEDKTYTTDVAKGETVTIQVTNNAPETGEGIDAAVKVSGSFLYYGSKANPIEVTEDFTTKEIAAGTEVYYLVTGRNGKVLTISGQVTEGEVATVVPTTAYVKLYSADGEEMAAYQPDADGNVLVKIPNGTDSWLVSIGNSAEEAETYEVTFAYAVGHKENPDNLLVKVTDQYLQVSDESGDNTAVIEAGDEQVYWYTWTSEVGKAGVLEITFPENGDWSYEIVRTSTEDETVNDVYGPFTSEDETVQAKFKLLLSYGDKIDLWVSADVAEGENQASVSFNAEYTAHMILNDYTARLYGQSSEVSMLYNINVPANTTRYFQTVSENANMTITGQSAFTVVYEGTTYQSVKTAGTENEYTVQVTGIKGTPKTQETFNITTDSGEDAGYVIFIAYPLGYHLNPELIKDTVVYYTGTNKLDPASEYNYKWTAPADGMIRFEITNTNGKAWGYSVTAGGEQDGSEKTEGNSDYITFKDFVVEAGDDVTITLKNPDTSNKRTVQFAFYFSLLVDGEPANYELTLGENQELTDFDLKESVDLEIDDNGNYHIGAKDGTQVLVDLNNEHIVDLFEWLKDNAVFCYVGESTERTAYSDILDEYLEAAQQIGESEEDKMLLYPLTEDLMNIIRNFGAQLGWYDSTNANYLFKGTSGLKTDSLWMFPCYYISSTEATAMSIDPETETDTGIKTETETETGTGTEPETTSEPGTEPETEPEAVKESEPKTDTETGET